MNEEYLKNKILFQYSSSFVIIWYGFKGIQFGKSLQIQILFTSSLGLQIISIYIYIYIFFFRVEIN